MDLIGLNALRVWLSSKEIEKVRSHTKENFIYVQYLDRAKVVTKDGIRKCIQRAGRLNRVTREVMFEDPAPIISVKLFVLGTVFHIPYVAGHVLGHLIKGVYHTVKNFFHFEVKEGFSEIGYRAYQIGRVAYYGIGIVAAIFLGVFIDPIKAREAYGILDLHLNGDISLKKSLKGLLKREFTCKEAIEEADGCYFADCMQPFTSNFDEQIALTKVRRYHVVVESEDPAKIKWIEGEVVEDCDWMICPILPCLKYF